MPTLDWIGKKAVLNHHREVPYHLLKCDKSLSVGDPGSHNLLVHGDNLIALKALLPYYAGQVKCVYIDPPYNTGNEGWEYNDAVNSPEIRRWLGKAVGPEADDLSRHDKWLCMMYPRLQLLRQFLRQDGAIVIHIDEHEHASLTLLMDELFGRRNSLGTIVWDKGNPKGDSKGIATQHETLVCYARHKDSFEQFHGPILTPKPNAEKMLAKARQIIGSIGKRKPPADFMEFAKKFKLAKQCVEPYIREYTIEEARSEFARWVKLEPNLSGGERMYSRIHHSIQEGVDSYRVYRLASMAWPNKKKAPDEYFEPLKYPGTAQDCPVPERGWRYPPATLNRMLDAGLIEFGDDHSVQPQQRLFLDKYMSQLVPSVIRDARSDDDLFSQLKISFQNPKPFEFATTIISAFTHDDDLVLDSFAGSGTTGHAVLNANRQDGGDRRFILIEMDAANAEKCSIRLESAITGRAKIAKLATPLGGGFRYCVLSPPLFDALGNIRDGVTFADLGAHIYFTETGEPIPKRAGRTPLLGIHNGVALLLLYNGILGDKRPDGGNVLTNATLSSLPRHDGLKVIYGEGCRLSASRLKREGIAFKQVPYGIKVS